MNTFPCCREGNVTGHLMLMLSRPLNMEQTSKVLSELRNNFMNNPITAMGQKNGRYESSYVHE